MQIPVNRINGRKAFTSKDTYLYFAGTAYLGIPFLAKFQKEVEKGFKTWGSNYGSSRAGNLDLRIYREAETYFADWLGMESALTFSSGYLAAGAFIEWAKGSNYKIIRTNGDHPSLWSYEHLETKESKMGFKPGEMENQEVIRTIHGNPETSFLVLCTSVNPILGHIYDFSWIKEIQKSILVLIDDSHGMGLLGKEGRGILDFLPQNDLVKIVVVSSLGKALGVPAGVLSGPQNIIEKIKTSPFFLSSSPCGPGFLQAFLKSDSLYKIQLEKLRENMSCFKEISQKWSGYTSLHPVFCLKDLPITISQEDLFLNLWKEKILISSFPYPNRESKAMNRVVILSTHKKKDLKKISRHLEKWIGKM